MDPKATRGYFNNNPGNMDRSDPPWNGEIRDPSDPRIESGAPLDTPDRVRAIRVRRDELEHGRFCVFETAPLGVRGTTKNLQAYHRSGFNTYEKAINRWAPPNENNTENYKRRVELQTGKGRTEQFDPNSFVEMKALVEAIIGVECAGNPYEGTKTVEEGLVLAGLRP